MDLDKQIFFPFIIALIGLIVLTCLIHFYPYSQFDIKVSKKVQEEVNEQRPIKISSLVSFVSILGNSIVAPVSVLIASLIFFITCN